MAKTILSKEEGKGFIRALRDAETLVYFPIKTMVNRGQYKQHYLVSRYC